MQNKKPFEIVLHVGRVTSLRSWVAKKSCHGQTLINECSISDYPSNFEDLQLTQHPILFQTVFRFAFLGSYIFISDQTVKTKSNRNRNCIFFPFPWESQGSHVGSFLLCFTYPPYLPLQTDTYIDELVEILLKLSMETVQVHLIIWTTLVVRKMLVSTKVTVT